MRSRWPHAKAADVMIAVAGLPFAHSQVIQYRGCTYLRRASHEELGLFSRDEARSAHRRFLAHRRPQGSGGCPREAGGDQLRPSYLMQLLGYYLVVFCNDRKERKGYHQGRGCGGRFAGRRWLLRAACACAHGGRAFPVRVRLPRGDVESNQESPDGEGAEVAEAMGKRPSDVGRIREALLRLGVVAVPGARVAHVRDSAAQSSISCRFPRSTEIWRAPWIGVCRGKRGGARPNTLFPAQSEGGGKTAETAIIQRIWPICAALSVLSPIIRGGNDICVATSLIRYSLVLAGSFAMNLRTWLEAGSQRGAE